MTTSATPTLNPVDHIDGIDHDTPDYVHLFPSWKTTVVACGIPRSEILHHGCRAYEYTGQTHCPGCGLPICPRCRAAV